MSVIKFFGIPWGFEEDLGPYDITGWFSPKTDDVITIYDQPPGKPPFLKVG